MKMLTIAAAASVALSMGAGNALADHWRDESGYEPRWYSDRSYGWYSDRYYGEPRYERRANKEVYRRGGCRIERRWDDDGNYKEKIKCKRGARPDYGYYRY
ncbi:hypothetical protein EV128_102313 [Rhizobium azibense]|nr:hypothetical protein EV128_102313 [Rhizobium azibense]